MASSSEGDDYYFLSRDLFGSVRLDAQHLLWKLQAGYTLHPRIPIHPDMMIAEIGTGTGIWLLDLAGELPSSIQLHGYDISSSQYPPSNILPKNVTLDLLDSLEDPPDSLVGKYDVVHLRFWCCIVRNDDPTALIRHAARLLKPGGYIQWEDADLAKHVLGGERAINYRKFNSRIFNSLGFQFGWLSKIPDYLEEAGLEILEATSGSIKPNLVLLCTNTYLMGHMELYRAVDNLAKDAQLPTAAQCEEFLRAVAGDIKKGATYHWTPITMLAQKPA